MSHHFLSRISGGCLIVGLVACTSTPSSSGDQHSGGLQNQGTAGVGNGGAGTATSLGGTQGNGGSTVSTGGATAAGSNALATGGASSTTSGGGGNRAVGGTTATGGIGVAATGGAANSGVAGKGGATTGGAATGGATGKGGTATGGAATGGAAAGTSSLPVTGNPDGHCAIPADAQLEDVSAPTHVVGNGSAASCTGAEFVKQVALGGVITFNCGPDPLTINLDQTAKIFNNTGPKIVIDGGGKIALSGQDKVRILYQNTCDEAQVWTTSHCDNQDHPQLTVQNLTFVHGNAKSEDDGGGAIFASGGRLKIINSRFFNNVCANTGPDVGGGAIRAFQQSNGLPLYVANSTFGGRSDLGNVGSNGGGVSSIGVSWTVINSLFSYNKAIGNGGNPADPNTPGGGSGGAIYNDGNTMTLSLCGSLIENNTVTAYGGAIFFVSNSHTGTINITDSTIRNNPGGSWYPNPNAQGISMHSDSTVNIVNSTITP